MEDRFWSKVDRKGDHECWEWMACKRPFGYGMFRVDGRTLTSHRIAYELHHKTSIPEGLVVRHKCDNPPCCNPAHLELGTQIDNIQDMRVRGRLVNPKGSEQGNSKLTESDVYEIRDRMKTYVRGLQRQLAREYGVGKSTIRDIVTGKSWKHLSDQ